MSLEKEMAAIIEAEGRPTGIMIEHEICVFIGFGQRSCAQQTKICNGATRIFQWINARCDLV